MDPRPADPANDESIERSLEPTARAQLYRQRALALEAELADTALPRLQEKLAGAAARFRELAATEDRLLEHRTSGLKGPDTQGPRAGKAAARILGLLGPLGEALLGRKADRGGQ